MGHGHDPAPTNDLGTGIVIDDGRPRATSLHHRVPSGWIRRPQFEQESDQHSQQVMAYATERLDTRRGDGECFILGGDALKKAGAKSAADFGKVTDDAAYVWGTAVLSNADVARSTAPGAIFRYVGQWGQIFYL
jgi:hypothetical protein